MTVRADFDRKRQSDTLARFQEQSGRSVTAVAAAVSLSDPQYRRYIRGSLPLRSDQFAPFAAAYGVSAPELAGALGLCEEAGLRSALATMLPESDAELMEHAVLAFVRLDQTDRTEALRVLGDITVRKLQAC